MDRELCPYCDGSVIPGTTCPKSITCPRCQATRGKRCRRPSGHDAAELHAERIEEAEKLDRLVEDLAS